jgi:phosphoenolpyruvate carboxylase
MRAIPATMASQHPDNAGAPYWDKRGRPFVGAYQEMIEAVNCFKDLDVDEYMWDWEGKHADAAIIDRLFSEHLDYFQQNQLARDKFLTLRIPNIWEEKGYNLLQAMTVILSSEDFARDLGLDSRPLFEVILPMTERADQLSRMQASFQKVAQFKSKEFTSDSESNTDYIEMIPLVESVESQQGVGDLLIEYVKLHQKHFGRKPEYIRPFLAGSDSALSSGLLAGLLGNKIALARLYEFADKSGIPVFPIAGVGSLRFRGGLSPSTIDRFIEEFPGIRTVTIQSAFRYDNPLDEVKAGIAKLKKDLPAAKPLEIPAKDQAVLEAIGQKSAAHYKRTINEIAADMQPYFKAVPKRRDRRQHIGLLAYSRSMGEVTLPRAITFTAAFYSIGVPPELIGLGRALSELSSKELALLKKYYPNLSNDAAAVGRYFNADNLEKLIKANPAWQAVQDDVAGIQEVLGVALEPQTDDEKHHCHLSSHMLLAKNASELPKLIEQTAVLRKSLG